MSCLVDPGRTTQRPASGMVGLGTSLTHSHIVSQGSYLVMNMRHGAWLSGCDIEGVEMFDKKDQTGGTRENLRKCCAAR